ncbi:MAG: hypothetical protein MRJ92_12905 [Nitrospira sp.]|nr:hypothetical protein [Nitrospira sp.]
MTGEAWSTVSDCARMGRPPRVRNCWGWPPIRGHDRSWEPAPRFAALCVQAPLYEQTRLTFGRKNRHGSGDALTDQVIDTNDRAKPSVALLLPRYPRAT